MAKMQRRWARDYEKDPIAFCLSWAALATPQLRQYGFSLQTGRTHRMAFRIRRAGKILIARPELQAELSNLTMREVLLRTEAAGKHMIFSYKN